jgi:hypothetical protein
MAMVWGGLDAFLAPGTGTAAASTVALVAIVTEMLRERKRKREKVAESGVKFGLFVLFFFFGPLVNPVRVSGMMYGYNERGRALAIVEILERLRRGAHEAVRDGYPSPTKILLFSLRYIHRNEISHIM